MNSIINFDPVYSDFGKFANVEVIAESPNSLPPVSEEDDYISYITKLLNSDEFIIPFKKYLSTDEFTNLISILIKRIIQLDSNFIFIDKVKIIDAINNPVLLDINTKFNKNELTQLIKQSYYLGYINTTERDLCLLDTTQLSNCITLEEYIKLLNNQLTYETVVERYIPEIAELQTRGLDPHIVEVTTSNFLSILQNNQNELEVIKIVEDFLLEKFKISTFLTTVKIESIYKYPTDFLKILSNNDLTDLLARVSPYLEFLTTSKINELNALLDDANILDYLTLSEIKSIMDKEVDLKYQIVTAITENDVEAMFNEFRTAFLTMDLNPIIENLINNKTKLTLTQGKTILLNAIGFANKNKQLTLGEIYSVPFVNI
jgi:hypothetical protein